MTDLKPCPICGHHHATEREVAVDYVSTPIIVCDHCGFFCEDAHWNALPRTRWVSVDERLPDIDEYVVWLHKHGAMFIEAIDKDDDGAMTYACSTHWLDGVPVAPTSQMKGGQE